MPVLGFTLCLAFIATGFYFANASLELLFDPASIVVVLGPPWVLALCLGYNRAIDNGFKGAFKLKELNSDEVTESIGAFEFLFKTTIMASIVGTIMGIILFMANLNDLAAIGPGLATALMSLFYGFLLSGFLYLPMVEWLKNTSSNNS